MDTLTHIAIGAIIGEGLAGKSLGKKAMVMGAIYQSIPDIDFLASFFLSPTENLLTHRGITHSFLFGILATGIFSFIGNRWQSVKGFGFCKWMKFVGLEILVHLLLDGLNAYGVGWFEPFSPLRIAYHVIFVADPLYSVWLGISFAALMILKQNNPARLRWVRFGLVVSSLYLCLSMINKITINNRVESTLNVQQISYSRYLTTPTTFNNLLWYCVAESDSGYYIGYGSVFDKANQIKYQYFPRNKSLLEPIADEKEVVNLLRFSKEFYTVENTHGVLLFNDLRFGRIAGWERSDTEFTFHYFLQDPQQNILVVQRGRFAEWNPATMKSLLRRIGGNQTH